MFNLPMFHPSLALEKKDRYAVVILNERLVNSGVAADIRQVCRELNEDAGIVAVVLAGHGDNFCRGTDWEELSRLEKDSDLAPEQIVALLSAAQAIASVEKPVIAAINGNALGQGLELALACDIRLASPAATFGFPADQMRRFPFDGATQRLPRLIGKSRALEMLLTGETMDAGAALKVGLVNQVVKDKDVRAEAEDLAVKMAVRAPISLRLAKEAIIKGMDLTLEQGLRLEGDLYFLMHTTHDRTEGITAFREKRKPKFKGS